MVYIYIYSSQISFFMTFYFYVEHARVMVLAATNRPSDLDEAIMRRLPQAFEVGLPDHQERAEILKVILKDEMVDPDINYMYIAGLCRGFSGSDLFELCKKAAYVPIREMLDAERNGNICSVSIATF